MQIVLNEVLYDPAGADGGYEFVELAAAPGTAADASLAGWVLETGNGSTGEWRVAWTGGAADRLAGGLFVIGEGGVDPPPHVVRDLDLQNGPDACRLRAPSGAADAVGWGEPLPGDMREGAGAADVTGVSLARFPDGVDTDDNAADLRAAPPSPGEFNAPPLLVLVDSMELPPAGLPPGAPWTFRATLRNAGRLPWSGDLAVECAVHPGEVLARLHVAEVDALEPGARTARELERAPPPGVHLPVLGERDDAELVPWPGGGGEIVLSEAMTNPGPDEPEWIELENVGGAAVDLAVLDLRDAAGGGGALRGVVPAGAFAVLAADTAAFAARWGRPAVLVAAPLPALNHTGPADAAAEELRLSWAARLAAAVAAADGPLASAVLPGGAEAGVSWERISRALPGNALGSWAPSLDARGGTPGRANSRPSDRAAPPGAGPLLAAPRTFRPARDGGVLLVLRVPRAAPLARFVVHDARGRTVASLVPWRAGDEEQRAVWDGTDGSGADAPLGLYVVRAEGAGGGGRHATVVLAR